MQPLSWDALGAIAELLGAVAVIATLAYISVQVRQSISTHRTSTAWSVTQALDSLNSRIGDNGEMTEIWLPGRKGIENLDEIETERFRTLAMSTLNLSIYVHEHPSPEHEFYNEFVA